MQRYAAVVDDEDTKHHKELGVFTPSNTPSPPFFMSSLITHGGEGARTTDLEEKVY